MRRWCVGWFCGTEIACCVVFQASLNRAVRHRKGCEKLPAKNKSRSFRFFCVRFSSRVWGWGFLADSRGRGFGEEDATWDSRALLQSCVSWWRFLVCRVLLRCLAVHIWGHAEYLQLPGEECSHFGIVNRIVNSSFFQLQTPISVPLQAPGSFIPRF